MYAIKQLPWSIFFFAFKPVNSAILATIMMDTFFVSSCIMPYNFLCILVDIGLCLHLCLPILLVTVLIFYCYSCWLTTDRMFIWSFAGPVAFILLVMFYTSKFSLLSIYLFLKSVIRVKFQDWG